jgi:pilus assembly protein Flp/PilA
VLTGRYEKSTPSSGGVKAARKQAVCAIAVASAARSAEMESIMKAVVSKIVALKSDKRAVTALEYGIIAGVLGLVLITIFQTFGTKLTSLFSTIGASI